MAKDIAEIIIDMAHQIKDNDNLFIVSWNITFETHEHVKTNVKKTFEVCKTVDNTFICDNQTHFKYNVVNERIVSEWIVYNIFIKDIRNIYMDNGRVLCIEIAIYPKINENNILAYFQRNIKENILTFEQVNTTFIKDEFVYYISSFLSIYKNGITYDDKPSILLHNINNYPNNSLSCY